MSKKSDAEEDFTNIVKSELAQFKRLSSLNLDDKELAYRMATSVKAVRAMRKMVK